ncbi:MAG: DNA polymerase III subunit chi [Gammaproteobacteria bacterium]|nr:DNA polymerase III subunit chi [Gammaproteobacteria bacterium]MDH4314944.1 DNA polymerase III subunit chi [Gammaproteobacteria bacterium]MDH5214175.1 DNA polymerase III subunit chi [Gammaproteobacteria bacterium]MDH5502189.1 DNA polymerase III subunit chi [Gammaproteobacteria bacterium]
MSRVDFYILADAGESARHIFACRLAEKAYRLKNSVHIRTDDRGLASRIDDLLWTFRDGSFVPHEIVGTQATAEAPVTIGSSDNDSAAGGDLLINLCKDLPANPAAFPRIAEIVSSDEDSRLHSRQRFAAYRDQGHSLDTHNI